jgi:hypothetical protein
MYTVEFESDAAVITTLDENDRFNDVEMVVGDDDVVYLRQFDNTLNEYQILYLSYQQLLDLNTALRSPEGAFYSQLVKGR